MRKFLFKISLLACIYLAVVVLFFLIVPAQYTTTYDASIIDKINRLEETESPKIILVGNSNLTFGMVSEELEEAMGMPVVNLGFHAGFGNAFLENMAKRNIDEGDIVIICHSDYGDTGKMFFPEEFWVAMENHFDLWDIPGAYGIIENIYNLPKYMIKSGLLFVRGKGNDPDLANSTIYARTNLNEYGDIKPEVHMEEDSPENANSITMPTISETCVKRINKLNDYCEQRKATLLIAGYPIADMKNRPTDSEFMLFQQELEEKMECQVISQYTDYIYDLSYFNAFPLHLTDKGAEIRTQQLISDLKNWE